MACTLIQGRTIDCRDAVGGIEEVYIAEYENVNSVTDSSGTVTGVTMASGTKFWTYKMEKENAMFTEPHVGSQENGTLFYEQQLSFTLKKLSASLRNEIKNLSQNRLVIIVKDNNGTYWMLGQDYGMDKVGGDNNGTTGKLFGDMSGYTLNFTGKEKNPANVVDASLFPALTTAA